MVETGWVTCKCNRRYYIDHVKHPIVDRGDTLNCPYCNYELARWGKGTDDYFLRTEEEMQSRFEEEAKTPTCGCRNKMVLRNGPRGFFYGCANYPNGCNETQSYRD